MDIKLSTIKLGNTSELDLTMILKVIKG